MFFKSRNYPGKSSALSTCASRLIAYDCSQAACTSLWNGDTDTVVAGGMVCHENPFYSTLRTLKALLPVLKLIFMHISFTELWDDF